MPSHIAQNAKFLQFHYSTAQAARYLARLGYPVELAINLLTRGNV